MKYACCVGIAILLAAAAVAEDINTIDGTLYKNITITKITSTCIFVNYDDGITSIAIENLSNVLQKKLGYDPEEINNTRNDILAAIKLEEDRIQNEKLDKLKNLTKEIDNRSITLSGIVTQVVQGGLFVNFNNRTVLVLGSIYDVVDGDTYSGQVWPAGTYSYENTKTIRRWSANRDEAVLLMFEQQQHANKPLPIRFKSNPN